MGVALKKPSGGSDSDASPFLGVSTSARGFTWRERLEPGAHLIASAISQRHGLPELLGRVLAARGIKLDEVPVVLDLIRRLKARGDRTILLVEHKMAVVRSLADRIVVLHNGRLVADGEPADVIASPIVQEAYLGVAAPAEAAHG